MLLLKIVVYMIKWCKMVSYYFWSLFWYIVISNTEISPFQVKNITWNVTPAPVYWVSEFVLEELVER